MPNESFEQMQARYRAYTSTELAKACEPFVGVVYREHETRGPIAQQVRDTKPWLMTREAGIARAEFDRRAYHETDGLVSMQLTIATDGEVRPEHYTPELEAAQQAIADAAAHEQAAERARIEEAAAAAAQAEASPEAVAEHVEEAIPHE